MDTLHFLYHTAPGRMLLKPLCSRGLSRLCGAFLDSGPSKLLIPLFLKKAGIDTSEYEMDGFRCFNDCFCRKIKEGRRPVEQEEDKMIAPSDGRLSVWPIEEGVVIPVKQSRFTVEGMLRDRKLAERYRGGLCLVYRLSVDHYHRYGYVESGRKSRNRFISGILHTVQPIALAEGPVFMENCREYTCIKTKRAGVLVQMEVGAMLVGRIRNYKEDPADVIRGEEKGTFLYGGSTIIVLVEPGRVEIDREILEASARGEETPVRYGQAVGCLLH
ncbi:MAG: phosphatidylserine decarboxylase [Eubacterium sp.]|nr:phosphatidylserine decarboxylase [Eubacterium sp.]